MESPHGSKTAYWDHEPRIGAFPGAEVGRLESRPSEQWFMESPQSQKMVAHWDHEPVRFMESPQSQNLRAHWDHELWRVSHRRDSVLDCGSLLPLSHQTRNRRVDAGPHHRAKPCYQSARGLAQSKTWRAFVTHGSWKAPNPKI